MAALLPALLLVAGDTLRAQAAPAPPAAAPAPLFSGLLFGSYSFQPSVTDEQQPNQADNAFIVDRAYLTVRLPVGERTSVRVTTDIYQSSEAAPNAYTVRAKYAYLQFDAARDAGRSSVAARIGILPNVLLDSQEPFWPRYLSQPPTEKAGYFPTADVGVAALVTLPGRAGEVYATLVNGPGYGSREVDRFKDAALRLTLTPLAGRAGGTSLLRTLTVTVWGYKGATASEFVNGGAGQAGAVGDALDRSRAGVMIGIRDPRLVLAAEVAQRHDGRDEGANTAASPRSAGGVTGRLASLYTTVHPLAFRGGSADSRVGIVARYDHVLPNAAAQGTSPAVPGDRYHNLIAGVLWDLSSRAQVALDYQESLAASNGVSLAPATQMKGWFGHFTVAF